MLLSPYDDSRLLVTLQIDHSRVAGLLAAHWGNAAFAEPRPFASVVLAAQEHDSGWWDWETKPTLNEQGYPVDYIGSNLVLGDIWLNLHRSGINRVTERDPYAGLLVSMHQEGLLNGGWGLLPHMPDRSGDPPVQEFAREQEALRGSLLEELRRSDAHREVTTDEHLWTNYKLMEVFDQLGQFLCNRYPFNSAARRNGPPSVLGNVPVGPGRDDATLTVEVLDERRAIVRPYPFDVSPLEISYPARLVANRRYASQDDFLREYFKAPRLTVTYTLEPA